MNFVLQSDPNVPPYGMPITKKRSKKKNAANIALGIRQAAAAAMLHLDVTGRQAFDREDESRESSAAFLVVYFVVPSMAVVV